MRRFVTTTFNLTPEQIAILKQVAKDNGESSSGAALRYIIDDWVKAQCKPRHTQKATQ